MAKKPAKPPVTRKKPSSPRSAQTETHPLSDVRVRMYRQGLGECFLLTFPRLGMPFHMLIECGVIIGTPSARQKMRAVVENIRTETAGRLDVVVLTHRHWDKLSGFADAQDIFQRMKVDQVWLNWTEDPNDPAAKSLEEKRGFGMSRSQSAVEFLRQLGQRVNYWRGGDGPVSLSGVAGTRVFFLAPPKVNARPRIPVTATVNEDVAISPFHKDYSVPSEQARTDTAFASYFRGEDAEAWWRIEKPRPAPAHSIMRFLPFDINNTSLVMAIELTGSRGERKVLLFPGDAEQANWSSWNNYLWRDPNMSGDQQVPITAADLLARTVLYKASHYAANSANPQFGLDLMTHPELTAMIAGHHDMAVKKGWPNLPSPTVVALLQNMTQGKVIRADADIPKKLRGAVEANQLFIDYFVSIPQPTPIERKKLAENWTAANERRVYLIDKKLAGTIRPEEEAELREIENLMDEYMSATAPTGLNLLAELRDAVDAAKRPVRRR